MTTRQKAWAASHDWFICQRGPAVIVRDLIRLPSGELKIQALAFTSFKSLREWAGY